MKKKVILHVGLHKTGSTSIQLNCKLYAEQLLNAGIYYPKFSSDNWENHSVPLSLICQDKPWYKNHSLNSLYDSNETAMLAALAMRNFLMSELIGNNSKKILFSAEDISGFTLEELENLKSILSDFDELEFEIIMYVRHPINSILSNAQELVRAGVHSLSHIFEQGNIQNAEQKIKNLQSIFGPECIQVYNFDEVVADFNDVTAHFFKLLECSHIETEQVIANSASSLEKILVLSAINSYGVKYVRLLNEHLPNDGTKISADTKLENYFWLSSSNDVDFLDINFGIVFNKKINDDMQIINLNILYLNATNSCAVLSSQGIDISARDIFIKIIRDTIVYLPRLSSLISVMAYNLYCDILFKNYILYFSASNLLAGKFVNTLYMMPDDELNSSAFNGVKYLLDNPDVARAGDDPFDHYCRFGKLEGRTGSYFD
jgi:hypothetical protein